MPPRSMLCSRVARRTRSCGSADRWANLQACGSSQPAVRVKARRRDRGSGSRLTDRVSGIASGKPGAAVGLPPTLAALAARALALALPARCPGCGREGPPICDACLPKLDARLDVPPGIAIGLPSDIPPPLLQLEWCAPFSGLIRRALHELKYAGEKRLAVPLGEAVARGW